MNLRILLLTSAALVICMMQRAQAQADAKPNTPKPPDATPQPQGKTKNQGPQEGTRTYSPPPDLENVSYGPHKRNVLDLWKAHSDRPTPLVVFFHPGGFGHGDKRGESTGLSPTLLHICLSKGISVAAANYRYSWQAHYPAQLEDSARVIQFLRYHAKEWNLNSAAVASTGASAGGAISMWLAFRDDMAEPSNPDPVRRESTRLPVIGCIDGQSSLDPRFIQKLVGEETIRQAGPQALAPLFGLPKDEDFVKAERAFPLYEDASAINFVKAGAPPAFLCYTNPPRPLPPATKSEGIHNYRFGLVLKERMDKVGAECVLHHSGDYPPQSRPTQMYQEMVDFFVKHFPK